MAMLAGRYTGTIEGDFVVFLIGMRVNKPWKVHRWRRFNRLVRGSGDVGIWHEAYRVPPAAPRHDGARRLHQSSRMSATIATSARTDTIMAVPA